MTVNLEQLVIRRAMGADLDFAWPLYRELMKPLTEDVMRWHDVNQRHVIESDIYSGDASIIMSGDEPVGWYAVREKYGALRLAQLYVVPALQNQGIGTMIVHRVLDDAQKRHMPVMLEVMKNNPAVAFYERLGFTLHAESKFKIHMICQPAGG